jgi:hypothetical protein
MHGMQCCLPPIPSHPCAPLALSLPLTLPLSTNLGLPPSYPRCEQFQSLPPPDPPRGAEQPTVALGVDRDLVSAVNGAVPHT